MVEQRKKSCKKCAKFKFVKMNWQIFEITEHAPNSHQKIWAVRVCLASKSLPVGLGKRRKKKYEELKNEEEKKTTLWRLCLVYWNRSSKKEVLRRVRPTSFRRKREKNRNSPSTDNCILRPTRSLSFSYQHRDFVHTMDFIIQLWRIYTE